MHVSTLLLGEAPASAIANAYFGLCRTLGELDDDEQKVCNALRKDVQQVIETRNDIAHGDWSIGDIGLLEGKLSVLPPPHPSLVPIEMAAAGMLTVTNSFENKTPEKLAAISPNLLALAPTIEAVSEALVVAADGVDDYERRATGSAVAWSRDWNDAFGERLIERLIGWLRR